MANQLQKGRPSRLKPSPCIDPLDGPGLVSKGDNSLLNYKTQEDYFNTITTRYRALAGTSAHHAQDSDGFATTFASLSLNSDMALDSGIPVVTQTHASAPGTSKILAAMRKLREAIVASSRLDEFAKTVYVFIIRTTIILRHPESYHPALLHLFRRIHSAKPLNKEEVSEFIGYYILDLACRQHDFVTAFHVRDKYDCRSPSIDTVLAALVHGNWVLFQKVKRAGSAFEKCLMGWASGRMTDHAIRCLGKSYLTVAKGFVEQSTGMEWEKVKESRKMSWACEGQTIIVKQVKKT